jgi:tetratricopeptide (TPR) repeat protein
MKRIHTMAQGFGFIDQDSINELTGKSVPPELLLTLSIPYFEREFKVERANIDDFHCHGRRIKVPEIRYEIQLKTKWPAPDVNDAFTFYELAFKSLSKAAANEDEQLTLQSSKDEIKEVLQSVHETDDELSGAAIANALFAAILSRTEFHESAESLKSLLHVVDQIYNESLSVLFVIYALTNLNLELPASPQSVKLEKWQRQEIEIGQRALSSVFPSDFQSASRSRFRVIKAFQRLILNKTEDAKRELDRYFEQELKQEDPEAFDPRLSLLRAYTYSFMGHSKAVDNIIDKTAKRMPTANSHPQFLRIRAIRACQDQLWSKACEFLRALLKLGDDDLRIRHDLAFIYSKLLKPDVSREILEQRFKTEAIDYLRDLNERDDDRQVRLLFASCLNKLGRPEEALKELRALESSDERLFDRIETNHFLGLFSHSAGQTGRALEYFKSAFELCAEMPEESTQTSSTLRNAVRQSLYFALVEDLVEQLKDGREASHYDRADRLRDCLQRFLPFHDVFKAELSEFGLSLLLGFVFAEMKNGFQTRAHLGPHWLDSLSSGRSKVSIIQTYRALSERRIKAAFKHELASRDGAQSQIPLYLLFLLLEAIKSLPKDALKEILDQSNPPNS